MDRIRRNEIEIVRDILQLCIIPSGKTRIVYSCNMNFHTINRYLRMMLARGILIKTKVRGQNLYGISEDGLSTLDSLNAVAPIIEGLKTNGF